MTFVDEWTLVNENRFAAMSDQEAHNLRPQEKPQWLALMAIAAELHEFNKQAEEILRILNQPVVTLQNVATELPDDYQGEDPRGSTSSP